MEIGDDYEEYLKYLSRMDRYREALQSIAKNTCCEGCQEAAKVASQALRDS